MSHIYKISEAGHAVKKNFYFKPTRGQNGKNVLNHCVLAMAEQLKPKTWILSRNFCTGHHDSLFGWTTTTKWKKNNWSKAATMIIGLGVSLIAVLKVKKGYSVTSCEEATKDCKNERKLISQLKCVDLSETIKKARDLLQRIKDETGSPGCVVGVSINGEKIWSEGLGYSDVENRTPCTADTVFRIASISKSITMGMVAKLWENGDLDLDKPIQHYLPQFPDKYFEGQKVDITTRQLVSHLGGIRHYDKDYMKKNSETVSSKNNKDKTTQKDKTTPPKNGENNSKESETKSEFDEKEYYIKDHYNSVTESLDIFQNDPLVHKPGSKYLYTTHGWTVVSAVVEKAANKPFVKLMTENFKILGLQHTYFEENDPLIYHRGRHYVKNKNGRLENAPYVDLSYKWAGGGMISDVTDLLRFGNIMLYSYQQEIGITGNKGDNKGNGDTLYSNDKVKEVRNDSDGNSLNDRLPGYLKQVTVDKMFTPIAKNESSQDEDKFYGMGWVVVPEKHLYGQCSHQRHFVSHTGGAIGASSVLLILPSENYGKRFQPDVDETNDMHAIPPQGVVVSVIVNLGNVKLTNVALEIAKLFEDATSDSKYVQ